MQCHPRIWTPALVRPNYKLNCVWCTVELKVIGNLECRIKFYREKNRGTSSIQLNILILQLTVQRGGTGLRNGYDREEEEGLGRDMTERRKRFKKGVWQRGGRGLRKGYDREEEEVQERGMTERRKRVKNGVWQRRGGRGLRKGYDREEVEK
jgi:hypothetical protein